LTEIPVDIRFGASESFVFYDNTRFGDLGDPARNGPVTVADYEVHLSIIDPDPIDWSRMRKYAAKMTRIFVTPKTQSPRFVGAPGSSPLRQKQETLK